MNRDTLRNFTVRFLESALRRVDATAKPFYGGRLSTGEAIRRLAEERLEEIEAFGPRDSAPEALLPILSAWRSGKNLALDDLRFLASSANSAYQQCRQDHVSRDLLVANVSAFRDAVRLLTRGKAKGLEIEDEYFLGNLTTSKEFRGKSLVDSVDRWIALLDDRPVPMEAEFASRNLYTYLRDEKFPDEMQLAKTLNAYVPELLQVAIRGYWNRERQPLLDRPKDPFESGLPPRMSRSISDGKVTVRPTTDEYGLSVLFEMAARECWFSAVSFVDLEDLTYVTQRARGGADVRGTTFGWNIYDDPTKSYELVTSIVRMRFDPAEFASIGVCLDALLREPSIAALLERLRYVYGRI
ncbi:MAG TPA: hypothetical protein VGI65_16415 [Steroidobacteraceae bacterium]|jgi:hypothetical protein